MNEIPRPHECFAVRGMTIIDLIHPVTGRSAVYGKTLEDCQREYPGAERMTIEEFCRDKAARQDTPVEWEPITEERYNYYHECLPPAAGGYSRFLVGEPIDHHAETGKPRYQACRVRDGQYEASNRPLTIAEFKSEVAK
jgi:hypothetical protein